MLSATLVMLLLACPAGDELEEDCAPASLLSSQPAAGETWVDPDSPLVFTLDGPSQRVELWVDGGVTSDWVQLSGEGSSWSWQPEAPLPRDATLTAQVRTCGQPAGDLSFSTLPAEVDETVVARTFLLDLLDPELEWIEPASPPPTALLEQALAATTSVLLMPTAVQGDRLDLAVSLGEESSGSWQQHSCVQTILLEDLDFSSDPYLGLGPLDLEVVDRGQPFAISEVLLEGAFVDEGAAIERLHLAGQVDIRQLDASQDYDLCGVMAEVYDATCTLCPDQEADEDPACLLLEAVAPRAPWVQGLVLDLDLKPAEGC